MTNCEVVLLPAGAALEQEEDGICHIMRVRRWKLVVRVVKLALRS